MAARFCLVVAANPDMPNAAAKLGAWMIGTATKLGGFPLSLSLRQMQNGFTRDGVEVLGTGSRIETIKASLEWLQSAGFLKSEESSIHSGFGHHTRLYTFEG